MAASSATPSALPSSSAADDVAKLAAAAAATTTTEPGTVTPAQAAAAAEAEAEAYERAHVHGVYEAIAPHFSATRHKPWPAVASFLRAQPPGALGLDVGCGNAKYLGVNPAVFVVGSDRSASLVALARDRLRRTSSNNRPCPRARLVVGAGDAAAAEEGGTGGDGGGGGVGGGGSSSADVVVADGLWLPFRRGAADFVICVAVIHHMSTRARRQEAIRQLLRCVKPGEAGRVLLYVWALEQGTSRRGWDEGGEQDLLVPWVMKTQQQQQPQKHHQKAPRVVAQAQGAGNTSGEEPPAPVASAAVEQPGAPAAPGHTDPVFHRYYHLYRKGELEEDVLAAGGAVVSGGYEKDNWWVVAANGLVQRGQP